MISRSQCSKLQVEHMNDGLSHFQDVLVGVIVKDGDGVDDGVGVVSTLSL